MNKILVFIIITILYSSEAEANSEDEQRTDVYTLDNSGISTYTNENLEHLSSDAYSSTVPQLDNSGSLSIEQQIAPQLVQATEYINTQNFSEAIALLRKTEQFAPDDGYLQSLLAIALNNFAIEADKAGNYHEAIELIEEAYVINPTAEIKDNYITLLLNYANNQRTEQQWDEALNIYSYVYSLTSNISAAHQIANTYAAWGRSLLTADKPDKATDKFLDALNFNPDNEQALFYLAQTAYETQDIDQAYYYWQRLAEITPDNLDIKNFLDRLSRERDISTDLTHTSEGRFAIHYDQTNKIDPQHLKQITDTFENAYNKFGSRFAFYPKQKIVVLLLNEEQFEYTTNLPHWVAGVYDGKIRIPISDDLQQMEETIYHEYIHLLVQRLGNGNVPRWINEGLAEYFSKNKHDYTIIKEMIEQNEFFPISELDTAISGARHPNTILAAYEEATLCIAFLYDKYSMYKIKKMVSAFGNGKSFTHILETIFGLSEEEFEENFKKYAKQELLTRSEQKQLRHRIKSSQ